jgi:hypothetical protein
MSAAMNTSGAIEKRHETAYFTFGRFQPPTLGHRALFQVLAAAADSADVYIFPSSTQDGDKNPLTIEQKLYWLRKINGDLPVRFINTTTHDCKNPAAVFYKLVEAGYTNIVMCVGSDRLTGFRGMIASLKAKPEFTSIDISARVCGKERNMAAGVSGTKVRAAAAAGNVEKVAMYTGLSATNARALSEMIVSGLPTKGGHKPRGTQRGTRRRRRSLKH